MTKNQPLIFIQRIFPLSLFLIFLSGGLALLHLSTAGWTPPDPFRLQPQDQALLRNQNNLWIDARDPLLYDLEHIPGALNMNQKNWEQMLPLFFQIYQPDQPVIVYCSIDCTESRVIADKLRKLDIPNIHVFESGFDVWKKETEPKK